MTDLDPNKVLGTTEIIFLCPSPFQTPIIYRSFIKSFKIETDGLYSFRVELGITNTDYSFEGLNKVLHLNLNGVPTPKEHSSRYIGSTIFAPMWLAFPIEFKYDIDNLIFTPSLKLLIETDWITPVNRSGDYPLPIQQQLRLQDRDERDSK